MEITYEKIENFQVSKEKKSLNLTTFISEDEVNSFECFHNNNTTFYNNKHYYFYNYNVNNEQVELKKFSLENDFWIY